MASIRKRGENSYQIVVSKGYDSSGDKLTSTKTITLDPKLTPKQAEKELQTQAALFEREVKNGTYLDGSKITFAELIEIWMRDYAEKQLEDRTLFRYNQLLEKRILPAMGHIKIQKLQPTHLLEFYNNLQEAGIREDGVYTLKQNYTELLADRSTTLKDIYIKIRVNRKTYAQLRNFRKVSYQTAIKVSEASGIKLEKLFDAIGDDKGLSTATIKQHHAVIHSALQKAVEWQLLFANPADRVRPPKVHRKEARHLNEEQSMQLLNALQEEPLKYQVLVFMDLVTGMRRGELMALKWSDIDLDKNIIEVKKAIGYVPGKGMAVKQPKNESSIRNIAIPPSLATLLKYYKLEQNKERALAGNLWNDNDWIFTRWDGQLMHVDTVSGWFPEFMKRHGLESVNFHAVRHTAATLLINKGLNVRALSARLGHANTSTTLNIYSHALQSADQHAADLMEGFVNPLKGEKKDEKSKA